MHNKLLFWLGDRDGFSSKVRLGHIDHDLGKISLCTLSGYIGTDKFDDLSVLIDRLNSIIDCDNRAKKLIVYHSLMKDDLLKSFVVEYPTYVNGVYDSDALNKFSTILRKIFKGNKPPNNSLVKLKDIVTILHDNNISTYEG